MLAIWKNNTTFAETKNFIIMIKRSLTIIASLLITTCMMAQSYSAMWKQVETASQKDLPKDKLQLLDKISKKAESERQYGHLLKAMLMTVETAASISPDSTSAQIQRIEERTQTIGDSIAKAVLRSALGRIYNLKASGTADLDEKKTFGEKSRNFYKMSLADVNLLASVKAETYKPFIVEEDYSRIFDNIDRFEKNTPFWSPRPHKYNQCCKPQLLPPRWQVCNSVALPRRPRLPQAASSTVCLYARPCMPTGIPYFCQGA